MSSATTAGDFLSLLLKPLSQRIDKHSFDSQEHERELRATALNNLRYPHFGSLATAAARSHSALDEEFYDVAFVFPAHSVDTPLAADLPDLAGYIGVQSVRNLLSHICVYRSIPRRALPRSEYSVCFHRSESPSGGALSRFASRTMKLLAPRRRTEDAPLIELAATNRTPLVSAADAPPLSPPLIEVAPGDYIGGGVETLSNFYNLSNIIEQSKRCRWLPCDLHLIVRSVFVESLQKLGAHTATTVIKDKVVVKMRLSERAAQDAAEALQYHLRVSPLMRRNGSDRYCVYDRALPNTHWQTYDGLSRKIIDPIGNADGSIFRNIDRIRLLMLQLQAHFNLSRMMSAHDLCETDRKGRGMRLSACLLGYFPLHRVHLQQYLVDSGPSLATRRKDLLDESVRCNYFGEEIGGYFISTKLLLWSLIGPILFGLVHSVVKVVAIVSAPSPSPFTPAAPARGLAIIELAIAVGFVIYLTVWTEYFSYAWARSSARIRDPAQDAAPSTPLSPSGPPADRIARDFERSDFEFDYYRVNEDDGSYEKYEEPRLRSRKRLLGRLLTLWLYLSLTTCLTLTFYLRAQTTPTVIEMVEQPTSTSAAARLTQRMLIPLLSRVQLLNYLQTGIILAFDKLWNLLIPRVLSLENHRFEINYRRSLVRKSCCFKFLNHFLPLLYSALISQSHLVFQNQLIVQVLSLVVGDFLEISLIIFKQLRNWRHLNEGSNPAAGRPMSGDWTAGPPQSLSKVSDEPSASSIQLELPQYDLALLTQDYIDIIIQLAHVLFFAPICPVIPLFAALRCLLQLLTQNYKLALLYRRIVTHGYPTTLEPALAVVAAVASPLSLALLLYSDKQNSVKQKLIAFVVLENLVLLFKIFTKYSIPAST